MKSLFLKNLSFFLTLNLLIKPIYVFGIDRIVQNKVGAEIYGSYFPLLNLVLIFQIMLDLGIENYTRKEVARNPGLTNRLFSRFILLKLILIIIFILVFSAVGYFVLPSFNERILLFLLLVNQSMANFILYLRANMGGLQLFKSETLVSVLDRTIMILLCGGILIYPYTSANFRMEWFVLAQTLAYIITLIISLIIVLKKAGRISTSIRFSAYIPIIKQLTPYALLVLLMSFYYRIDSVLLRFLLPDGKEQAGIYAHGFRILDFMSNYALIFSFILLPTFAKMIRKKEAISPLLRLASLALIIPSFSVLTGIFYYRIDVINLLYNEHIQLSANVFGILIIGFLGICISYTFGALLTANGNLKELNLMAFFAVVMSITLNSILIPRHKVLGAAYTNASIQLLTIGFHIFYVIKLFRLKIDLILLLKLLAYIAFTVLMGYLISELALLWYWGIVLTLSVSLIFSFLIKLLRVSYIRDLFVPNIEN